MEVTWIDSASYSPWLKVKEAEEWAAEECVCYTIGYVFAEDKKALTLAQTHGESWNTVGALWAIPKGCIRKVRRLS